MFNLDLDKTDRTQLIHFYQAIKMASALLPGHNQTARKTGLIADQIIAELKRENPDKEKIGFLTMRIQELANVTIPVKF